MEGTLSEIRMFAGDFAPRSWAYCAGQLLSIATNQALFSLLGTTYGGDGRTTFGLPDMRGRVPMGTGTAPGINTYVLGEMDGANTVTATQANMPAHMHGAAGSFAVKVYSDIGDVGSPSEANLAALSGLYSDQTADSSLKSISAALSIGNTGGNQPINIQQPYLGINYIICTQGYFPSRP